MKPVDHRQAGLTLMELLVAMTLFAVIGSLSYRALTGVRNTADRTAEMNMRWQSIALCFERLAFDVRQVLPVASRDGERWRAAWLGNTPDIPNGIEFSRMGGDQREAQRIAYRWQDGTLQLLHWPDADVDSKAPTVYPLLNGVSQARFDFLDEHGRWRSSWTTAELPNITLPRGVRLSLNLEEGIVLERIFDLP